MINRISLQALFRLLHAQDVIVDIVPQTYYRSLTVILISCDRGHILYELDSQSILEITDNWQEALEHIKETLKDENQARHTSGTYELRPQSGSDSDQTVARGTQFSTD